MYVKGADNIIKERLRADQPYLEKTIDYLRTFSVEGLRYKLFQSFDKLVRYGWG
jgi:hypothetical protein